MDVVARWTELMAGPDDRIPLDEAALLISASAQPALDVAGQLRRLDGLAAEVGEPSAAAVCRFMFEGLGLRGDRRTYDSPENSYIDRVLDRRLGIPIALAVLTVEIGRRSGVTLEPVGMPGHFLVRDPAAPGQLIDAFDAGRRLDHAACERLLRAATGTSSRLQPEMLAPTGRRAVLARMLANLDRSFADRDDRESLLWVSELRRRIVRAPLADRAQLAGRLASLGRFDAGAEVLEEAAASSPAGRVSERLLADALTLRSRLN